MTRHSSAFHSWFDLVEREVQRISSVSIADLPDMDFREMFDADMSVHEAAVEILTEAGFYEESED